jgi:hypothetical protein
MKRLVTGLVASTVAVLAVLPAGAPAQSAGKDSVSGDASECLEFYEPVPGVINCARRLSINVDVESGQAGENVSGTVGLLSLGLTPGGSPTLVTEASCLSVSGRVAIIGVTGSRSQAGLQDPIAGLVRVTDAGGLNSGADTVEVAYQAGDPFGPPLPGPTTCSTFPGIFPRDTFFFPLFTNEAGDVVVTDTVPFPTSKDQCKNGGWKTYEVFKNEGDCVSFVATKGKNPPGKKKP